MRIRLRGQRLARRSRPRSIPRTVDSGICVNCRYQARARRDAELQGGPHPGDDVPLRPAVPARRGPPERWDVVVFRYPEEPEVSYIKRLVGLPGETIRIPHGDVYVKAPGASDFAWPASRCEHRRPCRSPSTTTDISPRPWPAWPNGGDGRRPRRPAWKADEPAGAGIERGRPSSDPGPSCDTATSCPIPSSGTPILNGRTLPRLPRATLITDFYSYNTNLPSEWSDLLGERHERPGGAWMQPHWVGDLSLGESVEVKRVGRRLGPLRADQGGDPLPLRDRPVDRVGRRSPGARRRWIAARPRSRARGATASNSSMSTIG